MLTGLKKIAAGNPAQNEIEIVTPIGKRSVEYNSNPIWLNGKVVGYQTIIRDVTEHKELRKRFANLKNFSLPHSTQEAEEALRESEEKLQEAV